MRLITKDIVRPAHNRGHGYSNSFTLARGVPLYPQDTTSTSCQPCVAILNKYPNRDCDNTLRITQFKAVHRSWIIITLYKQGMDSPATPVGLSPPLHSLVLYNEPYYAKSKAVAHAGLWLARLMFHNRKS